MAKKAAIVIESIDFNSFKPSLKKANYAALEEISSEMLYDINQFVPKSTGRLRRNGRIEGLSHDGFDITWHRVIMNNTSAAEDLYEGMNPVTKMPVKKWSKTAPDGSPAGGDWFNKAKNYYADTWWNKYTKKFIDTFKGQIRSK